MRSTSHRAPRLRSAPGATRPPALRADHAPCSASPRSPRGRPSVSCRGMDPLASIPLAETRGGTRDGKCDFKKSTNVLQGSLQRRRRHDRPTENRRPAEALCYHHRQDLRDAEPGSDPLAQAVERRERRSRQPRQRQAVPRRERLHAGDFGGHERLPFALLGDVQAGAGTRRQRPQGRAGAAGCLLEDPRKAWR
jgi:hypothetical protein